MTAPADPRSVLPLSLASFHILLAIADTDRHGYGIAKEIESQTGGAVKLGPATLYRTLKQLVTDGWIAEIASVRASDFEDDRRRIYRLTSHGRRIAEAEAQRLADLVVVARARRLLPAGAAV